MRNVYAFPGGQYDHNHWPRMRHDGLRIHMTADASQQAAQLALWLGTSAGSVLLIGLQMPDTEDNRVLQLQSINAEPLPQASVKLSGQILCLTMFTCEARPPQISAQTTGASGASSGLGSMGTTQSASQSSSLEGDTLMQSPSSSGSSGSASNAATATAGGAATSTGSSSSMSGCVPTSASGGPSGSKSFHGDSLDSRSSLFLTVVSEKRARVYQVPAANSPGAFNSTSTSSGGGGGAGCSSQGGGGGGGATPTGSRDHHHHHHHHSSSSPSSLTSVPLADSPLAQLMSNKRNLIAECELSETSYACHSQVVQMRSPDECCLVSYLANGNLVVHALPRLRPILMDADFVPYTHSRISSSMRFARNGHCLYQPSLGEISKFTISAQYKSMVNDMMGLVYVPREMPEMPRTNFFKSLFSVSQSAKQSDRDELFGECSAGKATRGVAKHMGAGGSVGGQMTSGMDKLKSAAIGTMGHDMRVAREGLDERGEKLSEIEDRTLNMMNSAETYSQAAHQLAQKFKDKKWYQF